MTGLAGIVAAETRLSMVDGENGRLIYQGYLAKDLALNYSFEEVAYLLLYGKLPSKTELHGFQCKLAENRHLPAYLIRILNELPEDMEVMSVLRTAISSLGRSEFGWKPNIDQAIRLIAITPVIVAYRYRQQHNLPIIKPSDNLNHTANYLYMLTGEVPKDVHIRALTVYMILTMEHGMNASTFAARVVTSTHSDLASAIVGAIGAMKGPLHGGAPTEVIQLLDEIGSLENAELYIRGKLERGELLMGFGHRVYKTTDPRAEALRSITSELIGEDAWLDLAYHVEKTAIQLLDEFKPGRRLYTNVEFYAAAVLKAVEMPAELFTPTFTVSRTVGWTAHVIEQADNNKIFRPQSEYVGEIPS
ncbi:citrate synthase/methylcitrate synthase [Bacillus tamaricis]|uniref:Citrate synthase n=2 Tax=Evansella tamaricis TaxID=2069301 RepID=A0ABS6JN34_9BACI|nr:citrate synthase/methylcitrate synthase [Evansella tamaricis]